MKIKFAIFLMSLLIWQNMSSAKNTEPNYPEKMGKDINPVYCNPYVPKIDGILDDQIWQHIKPVTDFIQSDPLEGVKPTQITELKISYDEAAIYVGVHARETKQGKIISKLNRRDNIYNSDRIRLYFDSQHDHQTAFVFGTNPHGVQFDSFISNDGEGGRRGETGDETWNAVWEVETTIDSTGWTAEFRIPLAMLRFSPIPVQDWGFNFQRYIERNREEIWWVMKKRGDSGLVSRFGHINQLKGLESPKRLEFIPYATGRGGWASSNDKGDFSGGSGFDLKYGISSGITLDATINPDFGQVEADPEVLNLGVFETFYPEKRQFFIEGAHLFQTQFRLFHSRRIGKRPGTYSLQDGDNMIDKPDFTTIYGAAKVTGKTSKGLSFSVIDGLTSPEYANIEREEINPTTYLSFIKEDKRQVEPLTNYFVGRVTQDLWAGNSRVGAMFTSMNRQAAPNNIAQNGQAFNAYSGAIDWNLWAPGGTYSFTGQTAVSYRDLPGEWENGYAVQANFQKESGRFMQGGFELSAISPTFNINDLGYNRRSDIISTEADIRFFTVDNKWITRRIYLMLSGEMNRNYNGLDLGKRLNVRNFYTFTNYWSFSLGYSKSFDTFDDLETRGGPPTLNPGHTNYSISMDTDRRKMAHLRVSYNFGSHRFGSEWKRLKVDINLKPADWLSFSIDPSYSDNFYAAQWVTNVDDNEDDEFDHFIFGELKNRVLDVTMRTNISFSRYLSLQMYMQPFLTTGGFLRYKKLSRAYSYDFDSYKLDTNYDFKRASLKSNMVLRWEYRPGSTLYFVWTRSFRDYSDNSSFRPGNDLRNLFSNSGTNIVMVKWNYWMNI